ncbi:MAG: DUF2232 domain-containing protein [Candidatus Hydrogenedens sp.]|nr:DUF2232 domain-containing protein [Candidatus Hydrogenedens sp.]
MVRYFLSATGLLLLASGLTASGLAIPAMLLFPLPAGVLWSGGRFREAFGLVGVAGLAAFAGSGSLLLAALYVLVAELGVLLGMASHRGWSFGLCVALLTGTLFTLGASNMLLHWDESIESSHVFLTARIGDMQAELQKQSADGQELSEGSTRLIEGMLWLSDHLQYLALGAFFGMVLVFSTGFASVYRRIAEHAAPGIRGSFRTMRVPEWMVWIVIAVAGLWLIDYQWHNETLRVITWNTALGLSFVYWLNGLSIAAYAMFALQWNPIICYLIIGLLMIAQVGTLLCAAGLFDTWYDFRAKANKLIALRSARNEQE